MNQGERRSGREGRTLEDDIHDKEEHDDDGVPVAGELEVLVHACYGCEAEIRAINEGDGIHRTEDREKAAVYPFAFASC